MNTNNNPRQIANIPPIICKKAPISYGYVAPQLNHPEIVNLYRYGPEIPHEKIKQILALPRATLIQDLETVLTDAIQNFTFYQTNLHKLKEKHFVVHSFYLLGEIKAEESLPKILDFLEYEEHILDFFDIDLTGDVWISIYPLTLNNTEALLNFLKKPGINTWSKTLMLDTYEQIILHNPERKEEEIIFHEEILTHFINANPNDNIINIELISMFASHVVNSRHSRLLPLIEKLFDLRYIDDGFDGDITYIREKIYQENKYDQKRKFKTMFDIYKEQENSNLAYEKFYGISK